MMTAARMLVAVAVLLSVASVAGQPSPAAPDAPTGQRMVRAAGMPLQDGALPPGILTVRIVKGEFAADVAGQSVEIQLNGRERRTAVTGAAGRAEFAHIPIGAQLRVTSVVDDERLQSELFTMPAASGVRVLLMTQTSGLLDDTAETTGAPTVNGNDTTVRLTVVYLTLLAFALLVAEKRRRDRRR